MKLTTPNPERQWYELVKHNFVKRDRSTHEVVMTVQGLSYAQKLADVLTERLSPEEKEAGFAVYQREGKKPVGFKKQPERPPGRSR